MKIGTRLFLFLLLAGSLHPIGAQGVQFGLQLASSAHSANYDPSNPPRDPVVPSIGSLYGSSLLIGADGRLLLANEIRNTVFTFLGVSYQHTSLASTKTTVLGKDLAISSFDYYFGVGYNFIRTADARVCASFNLGFSTLSYEGTTVSSLNKEVQTFKPACGFLMGGRIDYRVLATPIAAGLMVNYRIATVERDYIKYYEDGVYQGRLSPDGDLVLPDNALMIGCVLSYTIDFHRRK